MHSDFAYFFVVCWLFSKFKINILFLLGGGGGGGHQSVKQFGSDQAQHLGLGRVCGWNGGRIGKGGELDVRLLHITLGLANQSHNANRSLHFDI